VSEGLQTNKRARIHCQKPGVKVLSRPRAHHLNKLLHEEIGLVNLWIKLSQLAHGLLFFRFEILRTTQKQKECGTQW